MENLKKIALVALVAAGTFAASAAEPFSTGKLYGYLGSSTGALYELTPTTYTLRINDPGYANRHYAPMSAGWYDGSKLAGFATETVDDEMTYYYIEFDWATGDQLTHRPLTSKGMFDTATLAGGTIYGFGTYDGTPAYMSAPASDPADVTKIADVAESDVCSSVAWNATEGYVAGLRRDGTLVSIATDGTQTTILQ
ncbi:MAG: hypothetical protein NC336_10410, partial [Clostridium sp.]|nr:hypothetical protein [Clostridium sp.]